MPRKAEPGISYYRINCGHVRNKKIRLLFNEFGSDGYWIWQCILDEAYHQKGYYFDCSDKDALELFATDVCKKQVAVVEEVILGSVRRGLFEKSVFDQFGILSSVMMQEIYLDATKERRKKGSVIEMKEELLLIEISDAEPNISIVPGKISIPPGRNKENPGRNPQSIVEESREEKSKVEKVSPDKPAAPKKVGKGKVEEPPEPYWQQLVDVYFSFVKEKFGDAPLFADKDPKYFKSIITKLKKRAVARKIEWTEQSGPERLMIFLKYAFADKWLSEHFLLKNLDEQFEKIGRDPAKISDQVKLQTSVEPEVEIQRLYESFQRGKPNVQLITEAHFQFLKDRDMVKVREDQVAQAVHKRMYELNGSNQAKELRLLQAYENDPRETAKADPGFSLLLKRMVVIEFFYSIEKQNIKTIFHDRKAAV